MSGTIRIRKALRNIFRGIRDLQRLHPNRQFTIDGRLVGDIGEMMAELHFALALDEVQQPVHDGTAADGRRVQIKATFREFLTFKTVPQVYLGLKLHEDGTFDEVYNGPAGPIVDAFGHRKGFGERLLSFPVSRLRELNAQVAEQDRVARRNGA